MAKLLVLIEPTDADYDWAAAIGKALASRLGIQDHDEAAQRGRIALWMAAQKWQPSRGESDFRTYAYCEIQWAMRAWRRELAGLHTPARRKYVSAGGRMPVFVPLDE